MKNIEFKEPYKYMVIDTCTYSEHLEVVETLLYVSKTEAFDFYKVAMKQHSDTNTNGEVKLLEGNYKILEQCTYDYN